MDALPDQILIVNKIKNHLYVISMTHSFVAYIDESGDDGLTKFRGIGAHGGASRWLIISACIFRRANDLEAVKWRDEIAALMPEKKNRVIHFENMNHGQRLAAAQCLENKPLRAINVVANKEVIPPNVYTEKNQLYFYMTRYLIERISWFCRDMRPLVPEGDGRVRITFSRRGGLSVDDFRGYLNRLKTTVDQDINIHWPIIDINGLSAVDHSKLASLQLADSIASSVAWAFEPDKFGNPESRYLRALKKIIYNRNGNYLSYGLKLVPKPESIPLCADRKSTIDFFR